MKRYNHIIRHSQFGMSYMMEEAVEGRYVLYTDAQAVIREAVAKEREEIAVLVQSAKFHEYVVNRIPFTHGLAEAIRARGGEL